MSWGAPGKPFSAVLHFVGLAPGNKLADSQGLSANADGLWANACRARDPPTLGTWAAWEALPVAWERARIRFQGMHYDYQATPHGCRRDPCLPPHLRVSLAPADHHRDTDWCDSTKDSRCTKNQAALDEARSGRKVFNGQRRRTSHLPFSRDG